jgi:glutamate dehydrogenase/leucine dehydrogenase
MEYADEQVAIIPDFIANCGMARVFAYLMSGEVEITDDAIFHDTSDVIREAMQAVHEVNPQPTRLAQAAFEQALQQLI